MTDFGEEEFIQIFCILPLGVPAYISAYTYAEILEPGGTYLLFLNYYMVFLFAIVFLHR